jgi:hypothetical protein
MTMRKCLGLSLVLLTLGIAMSSPVLAAGDADKICRDPALSHQEQTLCTDQIAAAQTVAEQKAIQSKFRDRIAAKKKQK